MQVMPLTGNEGKLRYRTVAPHSRSMASFLKKNLNLFILVGAMTAGVATGILLRRLNLSRDTVVLITFPGEMLTRMLGMIVLPVLVSSLVG